MSPPVPSTPPRPAASSEEADTADRADTHIAEQRSSDKAPAGRPDETSEAKSKSVPASRISGYQAEAAKLLAGAMPSRKRRTEPEPTDPAVAEDQADKSSRPAKKGQTKPKD